jgi:hypothetical protein
MCPGWRKRLFVLMARNADSRLPHGGGRYLA